MSIEDYSINNILNTHMIRQIAIAISKKSSPFMFFLPIS